MNRRNLFKSLAILGLAPLADKLTASEVPQVPRTSQGSDRQYWIKILTQIANPVLNNLSRGELRKNMPVEAKAGMQDSRTKVTYLETFGRLMAGMAPWLELDFDETEEGKLRKHYIDLSQKCLKMAVDPKSPDYMNFTEGGQPLVDAAFLAHAIQRAPNVLWNQLDAITQNHIISAMQSTRIITPGYNNWLLFSAMVESFLLFAGEQYDGMRLDLAIRKHMEWYKGDGIYGDGPDFHWDYYNSFVIQPMLVDVLRELVKHDKTYQPIFDAVLPRARRYAVIQEKLISPEGTFPAIGRSLAYRFGAFQLLGQMALQHQLETQLRPSQVRSALTAVIKRMIEAPGTFDEKGWLKIGFCGSQPEIGEVYISTGSLYLCSVGLLPLGLPSSDPFWSDAPAEWSSKKIWKGKNVAADHAL